ncbi:1-acyl-sn-glycerol-3-phosphate acyltransferase [Pseudaminobacter sp. 19-2017]|uniref:1-acyl-sn-glycerol-3-phosphate acyltransferase n=1 Tax=Pseudaminobacter soli (ex Zhang et al. 2022) TaxID=2831468 RepID=A0A942E1D9_9HYPH|nr:lysophospholipid acyltransferase family protein [Pseudaminobacter soli]MBS3651142.1 1-acyl-sn-glycerol-3-phosphate acyltransferase [Pseudaminobacter soli]
MIGRARVVVAVMVVALMTALFALPQLICVHTGWCRGRPLLRLWHTVAAKLLGFRIHVRGKIVPGRPLMLVSNHVSWSDIVVLAATADVSFVAKAEMANWPIFGWFSKMQRSVHIERDVKRKSGEQANEIAERLDAGDVMVLFAEGTTGNGNMLLPFKTTLFGAASMMLKAGAHETVWIQPVALAYTRVQGLPMGRQHRPVVAWVGDQDLIPHLIGVLKEGAIDVEVHFGEPIPFDAKSSRKDVAKLIEARVGAMMHGALSKPEPRM